MRIPMMSGWRPARLAGAGILGTSLLLSGCGQAPEVTEQSVAVPVRAARVEKVSLERRIEAAADVLAESRVTMMPQVGGMIEAVLVREGDPIRRGRLLIQIQEDDERSAVAQAEAGLAAAEAQTVGAEQTFQVVQAQHERAERLLETESISQGAYDEVRAGFEQARAAHLAAVAQRAAAEAQVATARARLEDCRVLAPFDGFVAERMVEPGTVVETMPPTAMMHVVQVDPVRVKARVPELELVHLAVDMPVRVILDALPTEPLEGVIRSIGPVLDPVSRNGTVEVSLPNRTGRIRPGMAARIEILTGRDEVLTVPRSALLQTVSDRESEVFLIDEEGRALRRKIRLDGYREEMALVVDGLVEGDRVISRGAHAVFDGQAVRIEQ